MKERDSNFELFRCVAMLMVIVLHFNNASMGGALRFIEPKSSGYFILHFLESISIPAVNGFIILYGYFDSRKNTRVIRKPVLLILSVIGYNLMFYFFGLASGIYVFTLTSFVTQLIPSNYYVILYATLFLISPYLNVILLKLSKIRFEQMLGLLIVLFSLLPTLTDTFFAFANMTGIIGVSPVGLHGADAGYTIINFMLLYFIGGYISRYYEVKKSFLFYFGFYLISAALIFSMSLFTETAWNYSNILVIFEAAALFLAFQKLNLGSIKWINVISKTTFGIYLIHTNHIMLANFWELFNISRISTSGVPEMIFILTISVLSMFAVSSVMAYIVSLLARPLVKCFSRISLLNYTISTDEEVKLTKKA